MNSENDVNSLANRQALADAALSDKPRAAKVAKRWARHWFRIAAFSARPLRRLVEKRKLSPAANKAHWDSLLSDTRFSTYLGGTINVDGTNALTSLLMKYHAVEKPSVLDVACSGGTLVHALPAFSRYLGIDVSAVAIRMARDTARKYLSARAADVTFEESDLRQFQLQQTFDVIVFNEVLYYLTTEIALEEVLRYSASLAAGGIVVVSMKDDGKSRAIFSLLSQHLTFVDAFLWQRKPLAVDFKVRPNVECPAWLVTAFRLPGQP